MTANLRVVSLNLWGTEPPLDARLALAVRQLAALAPDVVCLQEVRPLDGRSGRTTADVVADALGMAVRYASRLRSIRAPVGFAFPYCISANEDAKPRRYPWRNAVSAGGSAHETLPAPLIPQLPLRRMLGVDGPSRCHQQERGLTPCRGRSRWRVRVSLSPRWQQRGILRGVGACTPTGVDLDRSSRGLAVEGLPEDQA